MRPLKYSMTGVGTSPTFPVDWRNIDFQLSLMCTATGTVTYTIDHTLSDVLSGDSPNWLPHPILRDQTVSAEGNYATPVSAVRLRITAGTGTVVLEALQQAGN